jgi:hypothetical protein
MYSTISNPKYDIVKKYTVIEVEVRHHKEITKLFESSCSSRHVNSQSSSNRDIYGSHRLILDSTGTLNYISIPDQCAFITTSDLTLT